MYEYVYGVRMRRGGRGRGGDYFLQIVGLFMITC